MVEFDGERDMWQLGGVKDFRGGGLRGVCEGHVAILLQCVDHHDTTHSLYAADSS